MSEPETPVEKPGDKPPVEVRPSALSRHQLDLMTASTRVKSKNTLALHGIDVAREVEMINQGHAHRIANGRYRINGRVYVVKPNGATYPESGEGIVSVSPFGMALLRELIAHRDDPAAIALLILRNRRYTEEVVNEARWLFSRWKGEI